MSGCFHGLPGHLDKAAQVLVACWREGRTVISFHLGHSPKTGGTFPTPLSWWAPSQAAAAVSSFCLIRPLIGLGRPDLPPCVVAVSSKLCPTSLLP